MTRLCQNWPALVIIMVFAILATVYSVVNPLFESPDEIGHYEYVRWLVEGHGLARPEDVGAAPWRQEGSQPPLYYLVAAAITSSIPTDNADAVIRPNPHAAMGQPGAAGNKNVMAHGVADGWPWRGVALAGHAVRFFSILLGAVTVGFTYAAACLVFPGRRAVASLAAALVAFNPQFLFLSAAVNNDNLVIACCTAGVWLVLRILDEPAPSVRQIIALGVILGLAALSKLSGLLLSALAAVVLPALAWRRGSIRELIRNGLIIAAGALLVGGWWYARNLALYGDPLGLQAMFDILPRRPTPPTLAELWGRSQGVWRSAWAVFGAFNIVPDEWAYRVYSAVSLLGVAGLIIVGPLRRLVRRQKDSTTPPGTNRTLQVALLALWVLMLFAALVQWAQVRYPQGRLLFPALGAATILLAAGLLNWTPGKWEHAWAGILAAGLFGMAVIMPWLWIAPAFTPPATLPADASVPNPVSAQYGDQIQLVGYDLTVDAVHPGDTLEVDLYWRAVSPMETDYSVFVHLTDEHSILQAQRDSYPASGLLATSDWPHDGVISDHHPVQIPDTAAAPARLRVDVGMYHYADGRRLPVNGSDVVTLGYVTLLPAGDDGDLPNPVSVNFDDQIMLVGFEFSRRTMRPGETLELTFFWEALVQPRGDYVIFSHLVYPPDAVWAQMDAVPTESTSRWPAGQQIEDRHELTLPSNAPTGVYFVEVGIYDPRTTDRLPVNLSDRGIVLGQIAIGSLP